MSKEEKVDKEMSNEEYQKILSFYERQIKIASLRENLASLQSQTVMHEAKRLQAVSMIAEMTKQYEDAGKEVMNDQPKQQKTDEN